ncbi:hypothetical protein [Sphingopyxis panaciterrae]
MTVSFSYRCAVVRQSGGGKDILLFSASATEIDRWIGIPQRLSLSGTETAGFQRTVSPAREAALRKFFAEPKNVIQNPLLCAIRQAPGCRVTYTPDADGNAGNVVVELEDFESMSLAQLLSAARAYLESRVPDLATRPEPTELISELEAELVTDPGVLSEGDIAADGDEQEEAEDGPSGEPAEEALFDESQISSFWDQLRAREKIAVKLAATAPQELLGFSREMLISYLRPIILVDGQHRLRGAILAAEDLAHRDAEATSLIAGGATPEEAVATVSGRIARHLPVSLLMDDAPQEHVFQYVLVNQKATPVPKALLGTIISTSLAEDELTSIAERLEDAKIPLEGARIVSILSRAEDSPFQGLIAKGFGSDDSVKLQWNVLGSLSDIFRYLKGARFYHDSTDHAAIWSSHHLANSSIVGEWQARDHESPQAYWQDINGPWIEAFKAFWTQVRDRLASTDPNAFNYWGDPRSSNIFNKPTLHILTADFFSYLREQRVRIASTEEIPSLVDSWLEYASTSYFSRDWKLAGAGVKKDSVGTRRQWSKLWATHRQQGGPPPPAGDFAKLLKA